jgi:hypothetical protein
MRQVQSKQLQTSLVHSDRQDRSADALATFRAAAHQAGFIVTERRLHMSTRYECVFANEGRAGDDYVHLVVTWGA